MFSYLASRELRRAGKLKEFDAHLRLQELLELDPEHERDKFFQIANFCHIISQDILPTISLENVTEYYEKLISMVKDEIVEKPPKLITNDNTSLTTSLTQQFGTFWQSTSINPKEAVASPIPKFFNRVGKNTHPTLYYYYLFQWHGFNAVKYIYESKDFSSILKLARNGCGWVLDHLCTFLDLESGFLNKTELERIQKLLTIDPIDQFVSLIIEKPTMSDDDFTTKLKTLSNNNPGNLFIKFECTKNEINTTNTLQREVAQKYMHHLSEMGFGQATKWIAHSHNIDYVQIKKFNISQKLKEDYFKLAIFQGNMYELSFYPMMEIESSATICLINSFIQNKFREKIIFYATNELSYGETELSNLLEEINNNADFNDEILNELLDNYRNAFPNINLIKQNNQDIIHANFEIEALIELKLGKMFEIKDECGLENNISNLNLN